MGKINFFRVLTIVGFAALALFGIWWDWYLDRECINLAASDSINSVNIDDSECIEQLTPMWDIIKRIVTTLGPELGGIAFGVITLDFLNERRQKQAETFRRNRQLLKEFASAVPNVAIKAAEDLMEQNRLASGIMCNQNFGGANLTGAKLMRADFTGSNFHNAILQGVDLEQAILVDAALTNVNLDNANLSRCNLEKANLEGASLKGANLRGATAQSAFLNKTNFEGANLFGANLKSAFLDEANLIGANLEFTFLHKTSLRSAIYDESTVWPDKFNPDAFGAINQSAALGIDDALKENSDE